MAKSDLKIGVLSPLFPTRKRLAFGYFVKEQLDRLAKETEISLYAPMLNGLVLEGNPYAPGELAYPVERPFQPAFPGRFFHRGNPALMAFFLKRRWTFFEGCDIIHAHTAFPMAGAAVRVFGGKLPVVVTVHGSDIHDFAFRPDLESGIRMALNRAQCIIAVSESLRDMLAGIGITTPVRVIPNGVDTDLFSPGEKKSAALRLGLDPERPRILYIGNFNRVKNAGQLIDVMPRMRERHPRCELVMVGAVSGNPFVEKYRRMISERGLADAVTIVPMQPHGKLPDWIRASDMLALPSLSEGFGLVLAEALACGRPVVATRCGGPERIVEPGCGFLAPVRDNEELVRGMERVLSGEGVLGPDELAESARQRFSWSDTVIPAILGVYRDMLDLKRADR